MAHITPAAPNATSAAVTSTIPITAASGLALTAVMSGVGNSWFVLDPADYPATSAGLALSVRLRVIFSNCTAGDVAAANSNDGTFATFTGAAPDNNGFEIKTAWQAFPATTKRTYLQIQNQTAARGNLAAAFVEVSYR